MNTRYVTLTLRERDAKRLIKLLSLAVSELPVKNPQTRKRVKVPNTDKRDGEIALIKQIASELKVLQRTRKREVVTLRTTLVYFLRFRYTSTVLSEAFGIVPSAIKACIGRYEELKHYPDWEQAAATVNQRLKLYLPPDSER